MSDFKNKCRFNPVSGGTGSFVVASHVTNFKTPDESHAINLQSYRYHAESADGLIWEEGEGIYTVSTVTLTRATVFANSNNTTVPIAFASPPLVDLFPSPPPDVEIPSVQIFPPGTLMLFQQTAAPLGWTKQTTHNDKALRVVSGSASSGGSNAFSTVMAQTVVGSHTLSIAEMPAHSHTLRATVSGSGGDPDTSYGNTGVSAVNLTTSTTGSGNSHNHTITMSIQYVDLIIASKD